MVHMGSIWTGLTGLSTYSDAIAVVSNNLANTNTTAFKSSRVLFSDLVSELAGGTSDGSQVGSGVGVGSVSLTTSTGGYTPTNSTLDMRYYPIFVNLQGKRCLVVGAGQVGRRKITGLAESGAAAILVVDPGLPPELAEQLSGLPAVTLAARPFAPDDLDDRFLVIAATDDEEQNWTISRECARRGILCNIVDQPEKCSFIVPALFTQGELTVAISTGGGSPALARKIRQGLGEFLGGEYGTLLVLMTALDPVRRLVRPLLLTPRRDLVTLVETLGLPTVHDPSNDDPAFTRNRVAQGLLSGLAAENPRHLEAAARLWRQARLDANFFEAALPVPADPTFLPTELLAGLHPALRPRLYRRALTALGPGQALADTLRALDAAFSRRATGRRFQFPGGKTGRITRLGIVFERDASRCPQRRLPLTALVTKARHTDCEKLNTEVLPVNILIFGPNGSGKGTQGSLVKQKYHIAHIESGAIFREHIGGGTELGKKAKAYIDRGELVPDDITIPMSPPSRRISAVAGTPSRSTVAGRQFPDTTGSGRAARAAVSTVETRRSSPSSTESSRPELPRQWGRQAGAAVSRDWSSSSSSAEGYPSARAGPGQRARSTARPARVACPGPRRQPRTLRPKSHSTSPSSPTRTRPNPETAKGGSRNRRKRCPGATGPFHPNVTASKCQAGRPGPVWITASGSTSSRSSAAPSAAPELLTADLADAGSGAGAMASGIFLSEALLLAQAQGLAITHVDLTIIAQVPKIAPHAEAIRFNVAALLGLDRSRVNLKATTEEGLGFTGEKKGIKAVALVTGWRGEPLAGDA